MMLRPSPILALAVVLTAGTLSACATFGTQNSVAEVSGMPNDSEWTDALSNSSVAAGFNATYLNHLYSGGLPEKDLWDRVILEDKKAVDREVVSSSQLKVDIEIGQLIDSARAAIAENDMQKESETGANLKKNLAIRSAIFTKYTEYSANKKIDFAGINRLGLNNAHKPGAVSAPSAGANCVVVQGQGWTGCAPQ